MKSAASSAEVPVACAPEACGHTVHKVAWAAPFISFSFTSSTHPARPFVSFSLPAPTPPFVRSFFTSAATPPVRSFLFHFETGSERTSLAKGSCEVLGFLALLLAV